MSASFCPAAARLARSGQPAASAALAAACTLPLSRLARALYLGACLGPLLAVAVQAAEPELEFRQPAARLAVQIQALARQAGVPISVDARLTEGRNGPALSGRYTLAAALAALLKGSGLEALPVADGKGWVIRAATEPALTTLNPVTVIGTGFELDVARYPGSVAVLDGADLAGHGRTVDALSQIAGVGHGGDSGRGLGQQFTLRGFGYQSEDRVILQQDGVRRSASLFSNHISSFRSDNDLLKRVEVVKGASSINHGGGAIGGVVAMTTKTARDFLADGADQGFAAQLRYETNNERQLYAAFAHAPADSRHELLVYGKKGQTGDLALSRRVELSPGKFLERVQNDEDLSVSQIRVATHWGDGQRAALSHYRYGEDVKVTWQTLYHSEYSTITGPVIGELSQKDWVASYDWQPADNPWVNLSVTAYQADAAYDRGYHYVQNNKPNDLRYENADHRRGLRVRNEMLFELGRSSHRLLIGLDHEKRNEDALYVLNGSQSDFGSMPNTYRDTGLFLQEEASLFDAQLTVQLGGRLDRFKRQVKNKPARYDQQHFSPRLGLAWQIADGWQLLANHSESFRAPTPHETASEGPLNPHYWYLPNADLKPEIASEYEIGGSWQRAKLAHPDDHLMIKLMRFDGEIRNLIALTPDLGGAKSPQGSPYARYQNVGRVDRDGTELDVQYQQPGFGVGFGYETLQQTDRATGRNTPQGFADKLRLNGHWQILPTLRLRADLAHWRKPDQNPATYQSGGKTYWYVRDAFTQTNTALLWTPALSSHAPLHDLAFNLGINNLGDAPYINARNSETTTQVGKGRNVYLTVSAKF